jgi:hypothetical protein
VLRKLSGPKRDEIVGDWRKLHDKELHNLYGSPNRMIKSRTMRWSGHLARWGGDRCIQGFGGKARRKETIRKT